MEFRPEEGRAESAPKMLAHARPVTPGYFATMRIPVLAGEVCRDEPSTRTMMVNRSFANAYFAGSTPVGHRLQILNTPAPPGEVRGIVGDARESGLDRAPAPTVYFCGGANQPGTFFLIRTRREPRSISETVRRAVQRLEPQRSVFDLIPLDEQLSDAYQENRLRTILLALFAVTAVSLAGVGLYGTLSYAVTVRQREVGLRLALGALRTDVVRRFVAQGLRVAIAGGLAGLALAMMFGRLIEGMLYGVSATDPTTLAAIALLVLAVSLAASLFPALRAARVEPMQVLRQE
jgi:putative ABC transport system permease protein